MNYLQNLLSKTRQSIDVVQPRPLSRFELENQNPGSEEHEHKVVNLAPQDRKETESPADKKTDHSINQSPEINFSEPLLSSASEPILNGSLDSEQTEEQQIKGHENRMSESLNTKNPSAKQEINLTEGQGEFEDLLPKAKLNIQELLQIKKHTTETVKTGLLNERMIDEISWDSNKNRIETKHKKIEEQNLPTVKISIGRVEVKAVKETRKPLQEKRKNHTPQMTLQDYINLKK